MTISDCLMLMRWEKSGVSSVRVSYSPPSPAGCAPYCACCYVSFRSDFKTHQTGKEGEELTKCLSYTLGRQARTRNLDEDGLEAAADHASDKGKLLALPQVCERRELQSLADVLNTQALVV